MICRYITKPSARRFIPFHAWYCNIMLYTYSHVFIVWSSLLLENHMCRSNSMIALLSMDIHAPLFKIINFSWWFCIRDYAVCNFGYKVMILQEKMFSVCVCVCVCVCVNVEVICCSCLTNTNYPQPIHIYQGSV